MAYTNVWSDSSPSGGAAANSLATIIKGFKIDVEQRVGDLFALPLTGGVVVNATFSVDPLRAYGIRFTDAQDGILYLGDNSGLPRNLIVKDKTGTTTYTTIGQTVTSSAFKTNGGGVVISLVPTASGTYGSSNVMEFFKADGITVRAGFGYTVNNTQTFTLGTAETGGIMVLASDALVTAVTIDINQRVIIGAAQASYASYLVVGDGTALEPTWGLSSASLIKGLNSAYSSSIASGPVVHAHLLSKQTVSGTTALQGLETWTWAAHTSGTLTSIYGLIGNTAASGNGGTTTNAFSVTGGIVVSNNAIVTNFFGIAAGIGTIDGASSHIGTGYCLYAGGNATLSNGGTIANLYGLYVADVTNAGTTNRAIKTNAGFVEFGDKVLVVASTTARTGLNFGSGVDPTVPNLGDMWFDGSNFRVKVAAGTKTINVV